eukprot:scaffold214388_cov22-Prasinocladus_malaysianus.AAC.1
MSSFANDVPTGAISFCPILRAASNLDKACEMPRFSPTSHYWLSVCMFFEAADNPLAVSVELIRVGEWADFNSLNRYAQLSVWSACLTVSQSLPSHQSNA